MGFEWKEVKLTRGTYHHLYIGDQELGVLDADKGVSSSPAEFVWHYMGAEDIHDVTDITLEKQKEFCETLCRYKLESIYLDISKMRGMI